MNYDDTRRFGNAKVKRDSLKTALEFKQWSYQDLADKAGVSKSQISNLMNSRTTCKPETAGKIAKALGLKTEHIFLLNTFPVPGTPTRKAVA